MFFLVEIWQLLQIKKHEKCENFRIVKLIIHNEISVEIKNVAATKILA